MLGLRQLFRPGPEKTAARQLYAAAVERARDPVFYAEWGVPDTPTGRFDLIVLHVFLVMHRLKEDADARPLAQAVCGAVVEDMDRNLREMGVGDLSVGKKVKRLMEGFYGRLGAYEEALQTGDGMLISVLKRNLYAAAVPADQKVDAVVRYVRRAVEALDGQSIAQLGAGQAEFGPPPAGAAKESEG